MTADAASATPVPASPRPGHDADDRVRALRRPHPKLLRYYVLFSLITGPAFPVVFTILFLRYRTLSYRFDDEGVTMSWGAVFKREISLTYSRIQDIHVQSNAVERWLGLARLLVQTASGSAKAEMKVEGLLELSAVRNFMYSRMRGARAGAPATGVAGAKSGAVAEGDAAALASTLREIAREVAAVRSELERRR
ncbi:MAG: PH domain-containing protein [Acidobacteria bacterium]|nr:PH domain-containing protein [Acidobacteriota bacterium]